MPNNLHPSSSNINSSNVDSKINDSTHNRNVSLDSTHSKTKGLSPLFLNNETPSPSIASCISPGAHSTAIPLIDESVNVTPVLRNLSNSSKNSTNSRGSSPSRKKLSAELSGGKRRSPLASRKGQYTHSDQLSPSVNKTKLAFNAEDGQQVMEERDAGEEKTTSVSFNGSADVIIGTSEVSSVTLKDSSDGDDLDASASSFISPSQAKQKTKETLDQLSYKIQKTGELIQGEQRVRDENVNEYLKLSSNADKQQLARIKTVFEKKNQKSASNIQHLQKKLENYRRRMKEIEQHGILTRQPKEVLRDMGHGLMSVGGNIRDGISSTGKGLIGKPKEFAYLIKNKFGSADNIKEMGEDEKDDDRSHHGSATLPPNSGLHPTTSSIQLSGKAHIGSANMGSSGGGGGSSGGGKLGSNDGSECNSSITSESISGGNNLLTPYRSPHEHAMTSYDTTLGSSYIENILQELKERQDENSRLREEIEMVKQTMSSEVNHMYETLMEEKIRYERLEEQVNDLTELHQNEMENLKSTVKDLENMEEKVQYKNEENIKDLYEMVEGCQAKISRMEHQQAQQQQQFLTLEGLENSNARMLFVKLCNILLIFLQVLLLIVATAAGILTPVLQTKTRLVSTAVLTLFCIFVYVQLSEIRDCWHNFTSKISSYLT